LNGTPDLLNLFNEPAVRLLYYMTVIVVSCGALFMAVGQRMRAANERGAGRYAVASFGVLWAWAGLMIGGLATIVTNNPLILPPLDRAVSTIVVLLIGYAFLTADRLVRRVFKRPEDTRPITVAVNTPAYTIITVVFVVLIVIAWLISMGQWLASGTPDTFNTTAINTVWIVGTLILLVVLTVLHVVQFRLVYDAPLKIIFFLLMLFGYGYALMQIVNGTSQGDELGTVKLAFLVGMPLFCVVIYRFVIIRLGMLLQERVQQAADAAQQATMNAIVVDSNHERDAVGVLKSLGQMLERDNPEDLPHQIVVSVAASLKADVAAMLILDDAEYADVIAAYDNVQHRPIAAMALKMDEQPTLKEAIDRKAQRVLLTEKNLNELVDLYTRLDIQKVGPAYLQPMVREGQVVGILVIALPYTGRTFRDSETRLLEGIGPIAARLLMISRSAHRARLANEERSVQAIVQGAEEGVPDMPVSAARADMYASLELARQQINDLTSRVRDLQIELDYERSRMAELSGDDPEGMTITQRMEAMHTERAQLESERERLMLALQEAQTQLATVSGNDQQVYETMLNMIQTERDELQAQKDKLENELENIRARGAGETPALLRDTLTRMTEERARILVERDAIKQQLEGVQQQMASLGIEGGTSALASTIVTLTEERSYYKALAERLTSERDTLLNERQRMSTQLAPEGVREKIVAMATEMRRLAEDREALSRQRDALRAERNSMTSDRAKWEELRTKMVAELAGIQTDLEEAVFERNKLISERTKFVQERTMLISDRDKLMAERTALQAERDTLRARVEGNRDALQQLGEDGVGSLKTMIDDLTEERTTLEQELMQAQHTIQELEDQIAQAEQRLKQSIPIPSGATVNSGTAEVMLSIAQELRTPMSSIIGYADLLLGESVGILGALQRQFLTRVKANIDRLAALIEDFVRVTAIDTNQLNLKPETVDMDEVVNDAITATRSQFRDKNITLKLDVEDDLPRLQGDRDALQQILIQLLSNAYLASPAEGEVMLSAKVERNYQLKRGAQSVTADVVSIAVRDFGGGIPLEEQNRVFSRLYRADNPLIQGLGDTGVGLSIARALTEAHGGKIWLESIKNTSSTFKLVIPVERALVTETV
jgi:signal transduction histidine kinase/heme/copper-type cytochrome/quinol oxidase subunit 2